MSKNRFDCLAESIVEIKVENPRRKRPVIMLQGLPETTNIETLAKTIMEFNKEIRDCDLQLIVTLQSLFFINIFFKT